LDTLNDTVRVALPLAIVTSQTCDLQNPKRIAIRPFITIARVFDAASEFGVDSLGNIRRGKIGDLVPLTGADFAADDVWVADLRFEATIERGVMVGKDVLDGFADENGYFEFQRRLSILRARNAVDDRVLEHILKPLRDLLESGVIAVDFVDEIRLRALPTILVASSVELFFLVSDDSDITKIEWHASDWFEAVTRRLPPDLTLLDVSVKRTSEFTRADEIGTERLDLDEYSETV